MRHYHCCLGMAFVLLASCSEQPTQPPKEASPALLASLELFPRPGLARLNQLLRGILREPHAPSVGGRQSGISADVIVGAPNTVQLMVFSVGGIATDVNDAGTIVGAGGSLGSNFSGGPPYFGLVWTAGSTLPPAPLPAPDGAYQGSATSAVPVAVRQDGVIVGYVVERCLNGLTASEAAEWDSFGSPTGLAGLPIMSSNPTVCGSPTAQVAAMGIDAAGDVAGLLAGRDDSGNSLLEFLVWKAGQVSVVPPPTDQSYSFIPARLNANGVVVGNAGPAAYRYDIDAGVYTPLTINGSIENSGVGIGNDNTTVGYTLIGNFRHAVRWDPSGSGSLLGELPGDVQSMAVNINPNGTTIIGLSIASDGTARAVAWNNGDVSPLGAPLNAGDLLSPQAVNDANVVVGIENVPGAPGTVVAQFPIEQSLTFAHLLPQTPTFQNLPPSIVLGQSVPIQVNGGASGEPFTLTAGPSTVCTSLGLVVTGVHQGLCNLTVNEAGDSQFSPGVAMAALRVLGLPQLVTFTSSPPVPATVGASYTVSAVGGGSGNPVLFSSGTPQACTVSGNVVAFVAAGTCTILATQAPAFDYQAGTATQTIVITAPGATATGTNVTVAPVDPTTGGTPVTITFGTVTGAGITTVTTSATGSALPQAFRLGKPPIYYEIQTTATYTGPIQICINYAGASFTTTRLRLLHGTASGTWVNVTTSLDATHTTICGSVSSLSPFVVAEEKLPQVLTFTSTPPSPATIGSTYNLAATGGPSGDPITFSSLTAGVCTVGGTSVTLASIGTCTVAADQLGNSDYQDAAEITQSFAVVYAFSGFFAPVDGPPTLNSVNAGRTVPMKFSLHGNWGLSILAGGSPTSFPIPCSTTSPISVLVPDAVTVSTVLQYDATADQYIFAWKTDKSWAGSCREIVFILADGTSHAALFQFTQ